VSGWNKRVIEQILHYGDTTIAYRVFFVPSKKTRVAIHVHPDGSVQVDAPAQASLGEIKQAVARKAHWLSGQIERGKKQYTHILPREYVSGESHLYLGGRYLLKVQQNSRDIPGVNMRQGQLRVTCRQTDRETVKSLLGQWYRSHALTLFDRRLGNLCREIRWVEQKPTWKLLKMKKQWGSCSPKGVLSLNTHLIKAPTECIDYVLLHELCHLKHHNHGQVFYRLLRDHMPHWESVKDRLDGMAAMLLNE
jgi:predicted metal-dependent hydrolase